MPSLSKIPKSARFGQKNFQAIKLSPWLIYNAWVDILMISSNKSQIWKYFWKLDFCPHAGPIENSKISQICQKIFQPIKLSPWLFIAWKFFWPNLADFGIFDRDGMENSKNQPDLVKKIFTYKVISLTDLQCWVIFLSFQATKARFGNISEN